MPRHYSDGGRVARGAAGRMPGGPPLPNTRSLKERVGALRNLWPFLAMVWRTSPPLTAASLLLRLLRALLPIVTLYIGKLIIDDVVLLVQAPPDRPETLRQWLDSGLLNRLGLLLFAEFALAVLADILGRVVSLVDSLLSERVSNASSVRLMEHAATLDLEDFEDAEFQDQLERARRQTSGRMALMAQLFSQAQDIVTVASFAAGLILYAPWLIVLLLLALVPAFLGEAHFNAQSYSLDYVRTPERRELDYVRQTAASVETAKEVKIFALDGFLIDRYVRLATDFYAANRRLALRRAGWGGLFTAIGTIGYYLAYAYIVWRTWRASSQSAISPSSLVRSGACALFSKDFWRASRPRRARRSISTTCSPSSRSDRKSCRLIIRVLSPSRSVRASCSRMSASGIPAPSDGPCAILASRCMPGKSSRWSARMARARPPW
jgi:ATP-binding cassette subfamily B protein